MRQRVGHVHRADGRDETTDPAAPLADLLAPARSDSHARPFGKTMFCNVYSLSLSCSAHAGYVARACRSAGRFTVKLLTSIWTDQVRLEGLRGGAARGFHRLIAPMTQTKLSTPRPPRVTPGPALLSTLALAAQPVATQDRGAKVVTITPFEEIAQAVEARLP